VASHERSATVLSVRVRYCGAVVEGEKGDEERTTIEPLDRLVKYSFGTATCKALAIGT
jgi:hypothetical protein